MGRSPKSVKQVATLGKKYNSRLIKADYSYAVEEVADLLGNDVATVRRWVREDGLERIPHSRPHLIHSSKLKPFIEKLDAERKKPCACHEVFCFRCQVPRTPRAGSASITRIPNGSLRYKAICDECGGKMNRSIRGTDWTENHPLAVYLSDTTRQHMGVQPTHREC